MEMRVFRAAVKLSIYQQRLTFLYV